jgi:hypothetical protein
LQGAYPSRQRIAVVADEAPQLGYQRARFLIAKGEGFIRSILLAHRVRSRDPLNGEQAR